MKEYKKIKISDLYEHPENPRLFYRQHVIDSIVRGIKEKGNSVFEHGKALEVAPRNGRYVIYGGHHRFQGAKKANIDDIYCWVDNDITDDEIYDKLLMDNQQAELIKLEEAKHAYGEITKNKHSENSITMYAEKNGLDRQRVNDLVNVYEVYLECINRRPGGDFDDLIDFDFSKYSLIHRIKKEWWYYTVQKTTINNWTKRELEEKVKGMKEIENDLKDHWILMDDLIKEFLDSDMSGWINHKKELIKFAHSKLQGLREEIQYKENNEEKKYRPQDDFFERLKNEKVDKKQYIDQVYREVLKIQLEKEKIELKRLEEQEKQELKKMNEWEKLKQRIYNIDILKYETDNKFDTVVADFPYNISQDTVFKREGKADVSLDFGEWDQFGNKDEYLKKCKEWVKKIDTLTKENASLYIFCSWYYISFIREFINDIKNWEVSNIIVWHKSNPAPSFRKTTYIHSTEFCIFAKKGKPTFNFLGESLRMHNFYESGLVGGNERVRKNTGEKVHPAQKPMELTSQFLSDTLIPGKGRVLDAFAGTGTTAIAAFDGGFDWEAVDINKEYCDEIEKRLYSRWSGKEDNDDTTDKKKIEWF